VLANLSMLGLVISHSCDIDKFREERPKLATRARNAWPVTLAPVYGLENLDAGQAGDVRAGRHRRYFHLPSEAKIPELMADLWMQQPVPIVRVLALKRRATLDPEWVARLWLHIFVTTSRRNPKDVFVGGTLGA